MADGLWGAMFRRLGKDKCLAEKIKLIRHAKNGTGLTRLDQYNWVDEVAALATDPGADLFVGSFGINDRQSIVDASKTRTEYGGPDYDARYEGLVEDVVQNALAHGSSMLVMGLPVMLDPAANADATDEEPPFRGSGGACRFAARRLRPAVGLASRRRRIQALSAQCE